MNLAAGGKPKKRQPAGVSQSLYIFYNKYVAEPK